MNKSFLALPLLIVVLFSCQGKKRYLDQLVAIDSLLVSRPDTAYTLLSSLDSRALSRSDEMYYNLLYTIASDKVYVTFQDDSLIATTTNRSSFKRDPYKQFRANLYRGLVKFRINEYDSLGYYYLLKAEDVCKQRAIPDDTYKRLLYCYLADYNKKYAQYEMAEFYFLKERKLLNLWGDREQICENDIGLFWTYYGQGKLEEMAKIVHTYETMEDSLSDFYLMGIYNAQTAFYYRTGAYEKTIESGKKEGILRLQHKEGIKNYYLVARSYYSLNQPDSAMKYVLLTLEHNIMRSPIENTQLLFEYYKFLGELYAKQGNISQAAYYYDESLKFHDEIVEIHDNNAVRDIDKILETEKNERKLNQIKASRSILLLLVVVGILALIIVVLYFHNKRKLLQKDATLKVREAEWERQKRWELLIIKAFADVTMGRFEDLNKKIYEQMVLIQETLLIDKLDGIVANIKNTNKGLFLDIIHSEDVRHYFPLLSKLNTFSTLDKVILLMLKLDVSSKYVSKVIYSNPDSVRVMKYKMRSKIEGAKGLDEDERKSLYALIELKK